MTDNEKMLVEALRGVMEYKQYRDAVEAIKTVEDWV